MELCHCMAEFFKPSPKPMQTLCRVNIAEPILQA